MAPIHYEEDIEDANDKYHESSDEDFNPNEAPVEDASSSSDDEDATSKPTQRKAKGKRKAPVEDELDSGDEVTIEAAKKRKARKRKKGAKDDDDADLLLSDEGGEGGLVKTRAQRRVEQKERRPLARTEGATVDVDALWAQMIAAPVAPTHSTEPQEPNAPKDQVAHTIAAPTIAVDEEEQVTVTKVYTFAGQNTTEEKQVPRSSLDKHLSDGWKTADAPTKPSDAEKSTHSRIRRPLRRPSRFDPNPTGYVRALAPEFQLSWPRTTLPASHANMPPPEAAKARVEKAQKLNVVDKSRMDWTGFVDKEGIAEELDTHGKTKEAYLGRMDFLAGVEARKEEERKRVKIAAAAAIS
ncbi:BCNT-domain-containing protein [Dothidotthia symphoricarpi CBS 119687]|uniref:SWR1-complex protein 5 n=1 Tax=Dothidotthia symphoricarpi CBS 119687 TaxID=1392245 RepID=A0A6A6A2C6_9PLEO|nr:BCNT-domain-containing protein [Dothidotthia symphoricarpi CBS 119687]KAF2124731.1 BCNT-domain-containing protein [Dothidotthia symphoricarpi CBS 119687]